MALEKQLAATHAASEYQKAWFAQLRELVFQKGEPYAIVQADMPLELFEVMRMPVVSNQWWAALISAKQLSGHFLDVLAERGYHSGLCRYCSLGLASTLAPEQAPWGGLPKPSLLAARSTCDCIQRVFYNWAEAFGTKVMLLENPGPRHLPPNWWELSRHKWQELFETDRLDLMVADLKALIHELEGITRREFDLEALRALMYGVNRQEEYFEEAREAICKAPQCPVRMQEQIQNVMTAQWHRGGEWAVAHARRFRDEVCERAAKGIAAFPEEKMRLMWVGAGLWHDADFYTAFEQSHGAVFVWSMYLAFGPDGYIRYGLDDPLRALASRVVSMNEQLHNPPWANEWIVDQARKHRIDAVLMLVPQGTRPSATGSFFIRGALEKAGIPVMEVWADMVDARAWNSEEMRAKTRQFLDEHRTR